MGKKFKIGVDVGGTNVKIAIVDLNGHIVYSNTTPTNAEMGYKYTISNIKSLITASLKESNIDKKSVSGIGFGVPGQVDPINGVIRHMPNIPGWDNVPISELMQEEFSLPTKIDNDVRVATLGEFNFGAGKGKKNLVCLTVGTGIGSGIIVNGQLVYGASMTAGELGHVIIQETGGPLCGCGKSGCLEAFSSGPTIVKMAKEYILSGRSAKFRELAGSGSVTPQIVYEAAKQGDEVAKNIFKITGHYLGLALTNVVNFINPEIIIVGGGVAQAGELLLEPVRETINKRALKIAADAVEVVPAQLGESAGIVGAASLV